MCTNLLHFMVRRFSFKRVTGFVYLGSQVNTDNDIKAEIDCRIMSANKWYFGLLKHFRSRAISQNTKVQLYKTLVRPVLTYASECWTLPSPQEALLLRFEWIIYGPVSTNGIRRIRTNPLEL